MHSLAAPEADTVDEGKLEAEAEPVSKAAAEADADGSADDD